jgi:tRNA-dihydrouridine synthase
VEPLPVTVKHRIGIDERDSYEELLAFVDSLAAAGCDRFAVHARKAWLNGLAEAEPHRAAAAPRPGAPPQAGAAARPASTR